MSATVYMYGVRERIFEASISDMFPCHPARMDILRVASPISVALSGQGQGRLLSPPPSRAILGCSIEVSSIAI